MPAKNKNAKSSKPNIKNQLLAKDAKAIGALSIVLGVVSSLGMALYQWPVSSINFSMEFFLPFFINPIQWLLIVFGIYIIKSSSRTKPIRSFDAPAVLVSIMRWLALVATIGAFLLCIIFISPPGLVALGMSAAAAPRINGILFIAFPIATSLIIGVMCLILSFLARSYCKTLDMSSTEAKKKLPKLMMRPKRVSYAIIVIMIIIIIINLIIFSTLMVQH